MSLAETIAGLTQLSRRDRLTVIHKLQESLGENEPGLEWTESERAEWERRVHTSDADPSRLLTREQFEEKVRALKCP
jgi:putative addiction module component (TIGR02574 family)